MMGGEIEVISNVGTGSSFNFFLKNIEVSSMIELHEKPREKDISEIVFEPAKILLVDDIDNNRELILSFLSNYDLEILEAENGKIALEIAQKTKPDLILMDLKMPVMDGYQATSLLKADKNLKSIPVVALTASAMKEEKDKILDSGFNHYLRKPISQKELISELTQFLAYKKESDHINEEPVEIDEKDEKNSLFISQLPELLELLNGDLKQQWETIRSTFILNEINAFADKVNHTGKKYNASTLIKWSDKLKEQTQSFDMEKLPSTVNQFELFAAEYQTLLKNNQSK
jgi:two-component system sensor histidine kinase EvgS